MDVCNCRKLKAVITPRQIYKANIEPRRIITAELKLPKVIRQIDPDTYDGEVRFTPTWDEQIAETANTLVLQNITFDPIQTYETENEAGGITFII